VFVTKLLSIDGHETETVVQVLIMKGWDNVYDKSFFLFYNCTKVENGD